jgi:hypothetical protein
MYTHPRDLRGPGGEFELTLLSIEGIVGHIWKTVARPYNAQSRLQKGGR